jgi:hypothetical protein
VIFPVLDYQLLVEFVQEIDFREIDVELFESAFLFSN